MIRRTLSELTVWDPILVIAVFLISSIGAIRAYPWMAENPEIIYPGVDPNIGYLLVHTSLPLVVAFLTMCAIAAVLANAGHEARSKRHR